MVGDLPPPRFATLTRLETTTARQLAGHAKLQVLAAASKIRLQGKSVVERQKSRQPGGPSVQQLAAGTYIVVVSFEGAKVFGC